MKYHAKREAKKLKEIKLVYCNSESQVADIFTKMFPKSKLEMLKNLFKIVTKRFKECWRMNLMVEKVELRHQKIPAATQYGLNKRRRGMKKFMSWHKVAPQNRMWYATAQENVCRDTSLQCLQYMNSRKLLCQFAYK